MAKAKKRKKSKKKNKNEELQMRLFSMLVLFLDIVACLRLGTVGRFIDGVVIYLLGNFAGLFYVILVLLSGYVLFSAKLPQLGGPKQVGCYLFVAALMILASAPADHRIVGMDVLTLYQMQAEAGHAGFVGAMVYSVLSTLFAYMGSMIAAVFIGIAGVGLILGKTYFEWMQRRVKAGTASLKEKAQEVKPLAIFEKKKPLFFPDRSFDDPHPEPEEPEPMPEIILGKKESIKLEPEPTQERPETTQVKDTEPALIREPVPDKESTPYRLPSLSLLDRPSGPTQSKKEVQQFALNNAKRLTTVLHEFGVSASVSEIYIGPSITKYELKLETGTRVNKISSLQDDIKMALAAKDIRIEAPIPGKAAVGVEIPNLEATTVHFIDVLKDIPENKKDSPLLVPLGKDVTGLSVFAELDKMPHLLIAGATGSGKSVCVNSIICSLLMRTTPDQVKLMLADPKKVELSNYNGIPHLLAPVITDPKKAAKALRVVVEEMDRRYELFAASNARNISGYNTKVHQYNQDHQDDPHEVLPFIVVILDEVADLMMVASKDVEDCIMRISQMARAAGIHLIVATQRPSTDVITGVVKANIPSRIAFAVSSSIDSRTILDASGAEKLLGKGDMLFSPMGASAPVRVQGTFVSDDEVARIVDAVSSQKKVEYEQKFVDLNTGQSSSTYEEEDEEYEKCRDFVITSQKASASLLQRQFRIGYNKAARIIDQLEANGVIGPQIGSKPREVYIRKYEEE